MHPRELLDQLLSVEKVQDAADAVAKFEEAWPGRCSWQPVGNKTNNRGQIEVASDPARSAIERVTNAFDALLDLEHKRHSGLPSCNTPREAASAWLGVPERNGLAGLSEAQRRELAKRTTIQLKAGEGSQSRYLAVIDDGIGVTPDELATTILSLNESNKISKRYLAGTYGQGGSSTFNFCKLTVIASRKDLGSDVGFTVVKYLDLPPDLFKTGHYVYLTFDHHPLVAAATASQPKRGTFIAHLGFELIKYSSPLGPRSLYGALNRVLFDPVSAVWLENEVHGWKRVIKGSRNALNGAVDAGDEARGPTLSHHMPMFAVPLGDFGSIGIEYWVLAQPEGKTKASDAFVDSSRPIILTHNGQNQDELSQVLIRKNADLPYLKTRLVVHVNCDRLSPEGKRKLFTSTREQSREGFMRERITEEVLLALKSDDELGRLNKEAREESLKDQDAAAEKDIQREVARLLRMLGATIIDVGGVSPEKEQTATTDSGGGKRRNRALEPITLSEPPTFIRIVWDEEKKIGFHAGQRRYLRLETDANSDYHDPHDPRMSRLNIIVGDDLKLLGTSPLSGGRMRLIVECLNASMVGNSGSIRVELLRPNHPMLHDEHDYEVVTPPEPKRRDQQSSTPKFELIPVEGPDDDNWLFLSADSTDVTKFASEAVMNEGVLYVYYSRAFPRFASELRRLEGQDTAMGRSFERRYKTWLAVHSILLERQQEEAEALAVDEEVSAELERQERCRLATIAAMAAAQEAKAGLAIEEEAA